MNPISYDKIDFNVNGEYLLDTGEYLCVKGGNKYWFKDKDFKIRHRANDLPAVEYISGIHNYCHYFSYYFEGNLHCSNGPAVVYADGEYNQYWYHGAFLSKEEHDAIRHIKDSKEAKLKLKNSIEVLKEKSCLCDGEYILPNGEYLKIFSGNRFYYKDDAYSILHRENDLPAVEYPSGYKKYYKDGLIHRELGAAIINGINDSYWLNGIKLSFEDWQEKVKELRGKISSKDIVDSIQDKIESFEQEIAVLQKKIDVLRAAKDLV